MVGVAWEHGIGTAGSRLYQFDVYFADDEADKDLSARHEEFPLMMTNDDQKTVNLGLPSAPPKRAALTSAAAAKVGELIAAEGDPNLMLRLGVRPGGCSGFSYEMFFDSQVEDNDIVTETDGVKLVVDKESADMLKGATVDFKDDGLQGSGFAINNPNQQRSCGCGSSFS